VILPFRSWFRQLDDAWFRGADGAWSCEWEEWTGDEWASRTADFVDYDAAFECYAELQMRGPGRARMIALERR
jgi:hypothetical protein